MSKSIESLREKKEQEKRNMNIALVSDTYLPDINGVVSSTVTLKNALERDGHTVYIIANHPGSRIEFEDGVLRLPGIKLKGLYGYTLSSPLNIGVKEYVRSMDLDVVHLQTNFGVGLYIQHLARAMNLPVVETYHTMFEDYTHYINPLGFSGVEKVSREAIRSASRKVCNTVQAVVAPSEKTKEALLDYGVLAPIYVVPSGLDFSKFDRTKIDLEESAKIRRTITEDPDATVIGFLGRIAKEKSLEMLIDAMAENTDEHLHLAVVGAGPDEQEYRNMVSAKNLEGSVHFLGKAAPDKVGLYYSAFDAYASASLSETQGMTYLEALASGRPVFGRRDDVLDGLIDEDVTGYYFDSPQEFLEKVKIFQNHDEDWRKEREKDCVSKTVRYTDTSFAYTMEIVYRQAVEDFSKTFEITKLKIDGDFVMLTLERDSSKEPLKIMLPLEDYFEQKLAVSSKLDAYMVESYVSLQPFYRSLFVCKQKLAGKDMTKAQVIQYCEKKIGASNTVAKQAAAELEAQGLLDDRKYAMEKAEYYQSVGQSRMQIEQKLFKAGIPSALIKEALETLPADIDVKNAAALAKRAAQSIKNTSVRMKKQKIKHLLLRHGYSIEAANEAIEDLVLAAEPDALQGAFAKASRLYASKEPREQRQKIMTYCLRQGFDPEQIKELLESELDND
jgi:1,2-diacylglycerol 3-alpha-glucosyltransferase